MKLSLITTILLFSVILKAQTHYADGFRSGYEKGFCYEKGLGCTLPIAPIPPIPTIGELSESFQDGYNCGFAAGITQQKAAINTQYKINTPESVDFIYKLNYGDIYQLAAITKRIKGIAFENYQKGDFNTCIYLATKISNVVPNDKEPYMLIGMSYYAQKIYLLALKNLQNAKQCDPYDNQVDKIITQVTNEYKQSMLDNKK